MIQISDMIWVGDSHDERHANLWAKDPRVKIKCVLNVAQDLPCQRSWDDGLDYMQIGLIDGPGNTLGAYHAAVLALYALTKRGRVLVCCHSGGRALAVAIMYLHLCHGLGWEQRLDILRERIDEPLPTIHDAHRKAFDRMDWKWLDKIMHLDD